MTTRSLDRLARALRQTCAAGRLGGSPDAELLARFLDAGDDGAFEALVRRHGPLVLAACRRVLADPADVDDAFQATFLVLLRRASAIRRRRSVGPWLYGVAHRVALRARDGAGRRRRREQRAAEQAPPAAPGSELSWREACAVLHQELDRLPERYRLPLLLCYLDGKSRDEAARELGWPVTTLRGRLERGRQRLRGRLERRGLAPAVGLLAAGVAAPAALGAVPPGLVDSTLNAALRPAARAAGEARAVLLAQGVTRAMTTTARRTAITAALLLAGMVGAGLTWGVSVAGADKPAAPAAGDKAPAADGKKEAAAAAGKTAAAGRVLGPDGKPVAGAKLYAFRLRKAKPESDADVEVVQVGTTDADGRFRVEVPGPFGPAGLLPLGAGAQGLGADWDDLSRHKPGEGEVTLRLVKDLPIRGRILNTEGRPVAGATVAVHSLFATPDGRVDTFLAAWKRSWQEAPMQATRPHYGPAGPRPPQVTGADGRFEVTGCGAERVVLLDVSGPGIAKATAWVVTREGLDVRSINKAAAERMPAPPVRGSDPVLFGPTFDFVAGPARPVEGVVRDAGTGTPLAGIRVSAIVGWDCQVSAVTDARGRYRLDGLPAQGTHNVLAVPKEGGPYLMGGARVGEGEGLGVRRLDIPLARAVILTGTVREKETGKPVRGGVRWAPLPDNKYVGKKAGTDGYQLERLMRPVGPDGRFRFAAVPGTGVLMLQAYGDGEIKPYKLAVPDPDHPNYFTIDKDSGDARFTSAGGSIEFLGIENACKVLDLGEAAGEVTCDLFVERGRTQTVRVEDPDGKPLPGAVVSGMTASWPIAHRLKGAEFTTYALDPARPRTLTFLHPGKKLAGSLTVRGDEKGPPTVKLAPEGAVTGRILDADGQPRAGAEVTLVFPDGGTESELYRLLRTGEEPVRTDAEGRFRIAGLVPGRKFGVQVHKGREFYVAEPRIGWRQAEAGQTLDVGGHRTKPQ
jgi:RNA polymerase sigma factor (sigma-70 family)